MGIIKIKNAVSIIAAAVCSAAVSYMSVSAAELPTYLMNGSFEKPAIDKNTAGDKSHSNQMGAFYLNDSEGFEQLSGNEFYWKTTASTGIMEIVSQNRADLNAYSVPAPKDGDQFAELVGEEQSSLYQNISTPKAGTVINWGLSHAGRKSQDTMALFIGKPQDNLTKKQADGKDIFMWMAELITSRYSATDMVVGCTEHTIYSRADIDLSDITKDNYKQYFSFSRTSETDQKWKCWIITDSDGKWGTYSGIYTVPENQPETTFAFTAITGSYNQSQDGNLNEGNLLDDITFGISYPLTVSSTYGGEGIIDINGNDRVTIAAESSYTNTYTAGTEVTITAKATNDSSALLGCYLNNVFYSDLSKFTHNDDGSYSYKLSLNQPTNIQIVFGSTAAVVYAPNGGTYKNSKDSTLIEMFANEDLQDGYYKTWTNTEDALPPNTDTNFIGWYMASRQRKAVGNGGNLLVTSNHTIKYNSNIGTDDSDDTLDVEYKLVSDGTEHTAKYDADSGIVFIAEWEYKQNAKVKTMTIENPEYSEDEQGGSVAMEIETGEGNIPGTKGYGQLGDRIVLKATPSDGFAFAGWYDSDGNRLSVVDVYSYYVTGNETIYAYFKELHYPLVSFVAATKDETLDGKSTHAMYVKRTDAPETALSGFGGVFGNTISTGFITSKDLGENHSYNSCVWAITIPAPTEQAPLYIKKTATAVSGDFVFDETPVIEDKDDVQVNKGNIYKVTAFKNNVSSMTLNLRDSLPTVVTGGNVCYSITLDNIYAPGAAATFELSKDSAGLVNDKYIHSGSVDEFKNDKNNKYSSVKQ